MTLDCFLLLAAALTSGYGQDPSPWPIHRMPTLPEAISSFGACVSGGWLWVYGGHVGRAHAHSQANLRGAFWRLNLADGHAWQVLPGGPPLQGLALVAAPDGTILRIGGMTAHNAADANPELHSVATVARFDPLHGTWTEEAPLPEGRSSHDAAVLGNHVYVAGGWQLHGGEDGTWLRSAYAADLRERPLRWQALPLLDHDRRAAAMTTWQGRIALCGGLGPDGMRRDGVVFDPAAQQWTPLPELPGTGFGTALAAIGERLFATTAEGQLCVRDAVAGPWMAAGQLEVPRIFHRLLAMPGGCLWALGGHGRGGHTRHIERLPLDLACRVITEHRLPAPGLATSRQGLLLAGNVLWAFGGNHGQAGDRFAPAQLSRDIWRIDLLELTAARTGALPDAMQSPMVAPGKGAAPAAILGGLGVDATGAVASRRSILWFDPRCGVLTPSTELPTARTQGGAVQHGGQLVVFGGVDFTPGEDGGILHDAPQQVLVGNRSGLAEAGWRLPEPRRSFGSAVCGDTLLLVGGLGADFTPLGTALRVDLGTGAVTTLPLPTAWVSPQAATLGDRVYVACGGTMRGQHFTPDPSLWSWHAESGWRCEHSALPFPVRHVKMLAWRNRLLFYAVDPGEGLILRTLAPQPDFLCTETALAF